MLTRYDTQYNNSRRFYIALTTNLRVKKNFTHYFIMKRRDNLEICGIFTELRVTCCVPILSFFVYLVKFI